MHFRLEDVRLYEQPRRGTRDPPTQVPTHIVWVQLSALTQENPASPG
jgi:hypothetical protein